MFDALILGDIFSCFSHYRSPSPSGAAAAASGSAGTAAAAGSASAASANGGSNGMLAVQGTGRGMGASDRSSAPSAAVSSSPTKPDAAPRVKLTDVVGGQVGGPVDVFASFTVVSACVTMVGNTTNNKQARDLGHASIFACTWNMGGVEREQVEVHGEAMIRFWVPRGYDIYVSRVLSVPGSGLFVHVEAKERPAGMVNEMCTCVHTYVYIFTHTTNRSSACRSACASPNSAPPSTASSVRRERLTDQCLFYYSLAHHTSNATQSRLDSTPRAITQHDHRQPMTGGPNAYQLYGSSIGDKTILHGEIALTVLAHADEVASGAFHLHKFSGNSVATGVDLGPMGRVANKGGGGEGV